MSNATNTTREHPKAGAQCSQAGYSSKPEITLRKGKKMNSNPRPKRKANGTAAELSTSLQVSNFTSNDNVKSLERNLSKLSLDVSSEEPSSSSKPTDSYMNGRTENDQSDSRLNHDGRPFQHDDSFQMQNPATNKASCYPEGYHPRDPQCQSQHITPAPSPYWPYDAPQTHYSGFNITPSLSDASHGKMFQQQPVSSIPKPDASGITRIDTPPQPALSLRPSNDTTVTLDPNQPTQDYILTSSLPPYRLQSPTTKLLILDLNGTLLYRHRHSGTERKASMRLSSTHPILRPYLSEFTDYVFRNFKVMFWSSATPRNVNSMIAATTTESQRCQIIATWARDTLGLSSEAYRQKSITIKDLRKIFTSKSIRKRSGETWDMSNTILLDDSVIKASYQPFNHVCIPEFMGHPEAALHDNALWQVAGYLEELRYQGHVARFIKQNPFQLGDGWNGLCLGLSSMNTH